MPFCRECGKEVQDDWKVCPHCEAPLAPSDKGAPSQSASVLVQDGVIGGDLNITQTEGGNKKCPSCRAENVKILPCQEGGCTTVFCELCHPKCRLDDEDFERFDSGRGTGPYCEKHLTVKYSLARLARLEWEQQEPTLLSPFEDNDAFEWKTCNITRQCCVCCGDSMKKGEIGMLLKNTHDSEGGLQYLWIKARCIFRFAKMIQAGIENERMVLMKCNSNNVNCIHCSRKIGKGSIHLKLCNASDAIRTKMNLWIHRNCRRELSQKIKGSIRLPQKR